MSGLVSRLTAVALGALSGLQAATQYVAWSFRYASLPFAIIGKLDTMAELKIMALSSVLKSSHLVDVITIA